MEKHCYLGNIRTMDKVRKPNISEGGTCSGITLSAKCISGTEREVHDLESLHLLNVVIELTGRPMFWDHSICQMYRWNRKGGP
jgi:hypothetical protein